VAFGEYPCEAKNLDYLSAEEVRAFLIAAEEAGTRNELVCRLLVNTGMRREELVALTVGDIDMNRGAITLNKVVFSATMLGLLETHGSKKRPNFNKKRPIGIWLQDDKRKSLTGEKFVGTPAECLKRFPGGELVREGLKAKHPVRVVPLADRGAIDMFRDWTKGRPKNEFVFLSQKGGRMNLSAINRAVTEIMLKAGIERSKAHPHNLRHTFAIYFLKRTRDIAKLQRILGHTDIKTTTIYLRFAFEDLREALDQAGDLYRDDNL